MPELAVLAHQSHGRVRLRFASRRGDEAFFSALGTGLLECPGVEQVLANTRTASVLVLHRTELEKVFDFAEERQLFLRPKAPANRWLLDSVNDQITALDDRLLDRSEGRWGLSSLAFYGLLAATGYQIYRGNLLPAAETLVQHALKVLENAEHKRP